MKKTIQATTGTSVATFELQPHPMVPGHYFLFLRPFMSQPLACACTGMADARDRIRDRGFTLVEPAS